MTGAPATTLKNTYIRCRLGRSDLIELFSRATGHVPPEQVTVTTEHNSTRWNARSLPDLISDVTSAPGYDSHVPWDNLQFKAGDSNGELEVLITIQPKTVQVKVTGTNDILVHGQQARIELFLRNRGGAGGGPRPAKSEITTSLLLAAAGLVAATTSMFTDHGGASDPAPAWTVILMSILGVALLLTFGVYMYSQRAKLKILEVLPQGSTWSRFTAMEKVTVAGLYVTILGVVGTLASGVSDVLGLFKK
ncbi:hypothetical protein Stsp01_40030 [Streptomyces sp. NBRC 13847]|uniref:hypothetical protein n=1 Tax=Streptomyces TaxID=1883 RepID=UPI0024A0A828|nr:hypothetical protein [Streptomyces sp. NBRC 13847]GLW17260.1 hypothetical protein Stsp01_40030 [Streptomyces sp. NBRC 13847]